MTGLSFAPIQLAEVKVRILEAKQTLEDCIAAHEFGQAAVLKDTITELENRRNQIIQEAAECNQPADKEAATEKVNKLHQKLHRLFIMPACSILFQEITCILISFHLFFL